MIKNNIHIVFVGAVTGPKFDHLYGNNSGASFGGLRKMELMLSALLDFGARVTVISTAVNDVSSWGCRRGFSEWLVFDDKKVRCVYPGTILQKPLGSAVLLATGLLAAIQVRLKDVNGIITYNAQSVEAAICVGIRFHNSGARLVIELDDLPDARDRGWNPKPFIDRLVVSWMLHRSNAVVAVNESICNHIGFNIKPDIILPGIISRELIYSRQFRRPNFSGPNKIVGYAGGLSQERGTDRLLKAIPSLPAGWHMVIAGRGPMTRDFISAAAENPTKLTFRGSLNTSEVVNLYQNADVLVNTPESLSRPDAVFPFKIFEYLASGASVVSSALPRNGVVDTSLVETWDGQAQTLADALLNEERRWLNVRDRYNNIAEQLASEFSISAVGRKLLKLF